MVHYREIIEDNLQYNAKTTHTTVKSAFKAEYKFNSIKESMFVREKIIRGFFEN